MAARGPAKTIAKMLDALSQAKDPGTRLQSVRRLMQAADQLEIQAVSQARRAGLTWAEIGDVYGMSKQAAQQRFRRNIES